MNLLISCIGKRGYVAEAFRPHLAPGDRILGTANTAWTPGFRACDAGFILPSATDEAYVPELLALCEREGVDALVCVEDFDLEVLARARPQFVERGIAPLFPSAAVAERSLDKYETHEFLRAQGVPTPRTVLSPAQAGDLGFPLYVKPRRGSGSKHLFRARTPAELDVFFHYADDMLIQDEVVGQEIDLQLCGDFEGRPVGICALYKRCMRHGETSQAVTFYDPEVIRFGLELAKVFGAVGPMDVDVVRVGDEFFVLDVNTRFNGCYPAAHLAGADFAKLLLALLRTGRVDDPDFSYAPGVVMLKDLRVLGGEGDTFFRDALRVRPR